MKARLRAVNGNSMAEVYGEKKCALRFTMVPYQWTDPAQIKSVVVGSVALPVKRSQLEAQLEAP